MTRWECRYSSCEMMYLELHTVTVRCYLDHHAHHPDVYTFQEVLAGQMDNEVGAVFGQDVLDQLKAAARGD